MKRGDEISKSRRLSGSESVKHKPALSPGFPSSANITTIHTDPEAKILRIILDSSFFLLLYPHQVQIQPKCLTHLMRSLHPYYHLPRLNSYDVSPGLLAEPSTLSHSITLPLSIPFHSPQTVSVAVASRILAFPKVNLLILGICEYVSLSVKRDFADVIKLRAFKMGDYVGLSW